MHAQIDDANLNKPIDNFFLLHGKSKWTNEMENHMKQTRSRETEKTSKTKLEIAEDEKCVILDRIKIQLNEKQERKLCTVIVHN